MSREFGIPVELPLPPGPLTRALGMVLALIATAVVATRWPWFGVVLVPWALRECVRRLRPTPTGPRLRGRSTGGWELLATDGSRHPTELLGRPFVSRWLVAATVGAATPPLSLVSWRVEQPELHRRLLQRLRAGREPASP